MSAEWLNFKACLDNSGNSVVYIDGEGNERPIAGECDFEEAVRLARLNKNRLKVILYCNKSEAPIRDQPSCNEALPRNLSYKNDFHHLSFEAMENKPPSKENHEGNQECPPNWFLLHLKKFKKELLQELKKEVLHELKTSLSDAIQIAVEKERKISSQKQETTDRLYNKIEIASGAATSQSKKKKKGSEKDLGDILDQRETKLVKKSGHSSKFEKLEKLDSKTRILLEEKRRLLEKKRHLKQRLDKNYGIVSEGEKLKKSGSFQRDETCLLLPPNANFVLNLKYINDGIVPWEAPWIECFDFCGLYPKEVRFCLPVLQPMQTGYTTIKGKVSDSVGIHHFKCRIFDGLKRISPEFTCWAKVDIDESGKKAPTSGYALPEPDWITENFGNGRTDAKDKFAATQIKIQENINEIRRRLKDMEHRRSRAHFAQVLKNNADKPTIKKTPLINDWDFPQNAEGTEKIREETPQQEGVYLGLSCLQYDFPAKLEIKERQDENGKVENIDKHMKNDELEDSSDSELSVVLLSEEEENFTIIPLLSESVNHGGSADEDMSFALTAAEEPTKDLDASAEPVEQKPSAESLKPEIQENNKEAFNISEKRQWLPGPSAEVSKSKLKKIKANSTEYHFTTDSLTKPRFIQSPERILEQRPFQFTFTGDKKDEESPSDRGAEGRIPPTDKKETSQGKNELNGYDTPATKNVYAVNSRGECFLVGNGGDPRRISTDNPDENPKNKQPGNSSKSEGQNGRYNELPVVDVFPISLIIKASNMACLAVNTALSVINNLPATFATEGKTEVGKPAFENKTRILPEEDSQMAILVEMGFTDLELNQGLLLAHGNDMRKVVEDLLLMRENPSRESS